MGTAAHKSTVFVAGHGGMVGSALVRQLSHDPQLVVLTADRSELDLLNQPAVFEFFKDNDIDQVYLAAAKVGGIQANNLYPADFIYQNLTVQCNVIEAAHRSGVSRLLFLGSSCIYPRMATQPMTESALLTGQLEATNEPYAIAKIAGIKLCESYNRQFNCDYRSVMPTNLYGAGDNFHPENSHVIPALIRRFHEALTQGHEALTIWGSGSPKREFLHVDDMASACIHVMNLEMEQYRRTCPDTQSHINIGTGEDITIADLAYLLADVSGFKGRVEFDTSRPDGTPRKLLDVSLIHSLGWRHSIELKKGLKQTWSWYGENVAGTRTV